MTAPGVYREEFTLALPPALRTGVPVFLGPTAAGAGAEPFALERSDELASRVGDPLPGTFVARAVAGFFANGGERCYVVSLDDPPAEDYRLGELGRGLAAAAGLEDVDLVCAPDVVRRRDMPDAPLNAASELAPMTFQQAALVMHCDQLNDRVALLDGLPRAGVQDTLEQRRRVLEAAASSGANAALYQPWVLTADGPMPPSGHVAGVVARSDRSHGVHKAPANERLTGVLGLATEVSTAEQAQLNPHGVNCIRAFPGRGVLVWGARTLSGPPWTYLPVRRLFLTTGRWIELALADAAFEPNDEALWARIRREVGAYLQDLFEAGALRGASPAEAFYVKCDEETNPRESRDEGTTTTEIGIAAAEPYEFVVVRIIHHPGGVEVTAPTPG